MWWNHIAAALLTRQQFGLVVIRATHNNVESQQGIMNGQQQVEHGRVAGWNKGPSHLKWCYNTHTRRGWLKTSSSHHSPLLWFYFDKKSSAYPVRKPRIWMHHIFAGSLVNSKTACLAVVLGEPTKVVENSQLFKQLGHKTLKMATKDAADTPNFISFVEGSA